MAYRNPKADLGRGVSQKKLASEAYRATGGVARNTIANRAIVGHTFFFSAWSLWRGRRSWKNKAEKIAEKISPSNFAVKFAGHFLKIRLTKIRKSWKNKAEKFAEKNSPSNFAEKCAGYFPRIRLTKIRNSTQIRSAEPRAVYLGSGEGTNLCWDAFWPQEALCTF